MMSLRLPAKDDMRAVLICHNAELALVVLKALRANRVRTLLVCGKAAYAMLRSSRLVDAILLSGDLAARPDTVAEAINEQHRIAPIDIAMAADVDGLRLLHAMRLRLEPPVYPMPALDVLDLLNDKWSFHKLAVHLGLVVPRTLFYAGREQVDCSHISREIGFPAVVKPVSQWASIGFRLVESERHLAALVGDPTYGFDGVVVQQFIPGRDIGAGLFMRGGAVQALSTFFCGPRDATEFVHIPELATSVGRVAAETRYEGVANFDARMDDNGRVWLIECNPRFFMRITAARVCGLDFLRLGLPGVAPASVPRARGRYYSLGDIASMSGLGRVLSGRWPARVFLNSLREACADPAPSIVRRLSRGKAQA
jgi:biotin carboxylase